MPATASTRRDHSYAGTTRREVRGRNLPKACAAHGRQIPWLTCGAPVRITPLHHAQTSVGSSGPALVTFFISPSFDCGPRKLFKQSMARACSRNVVEPWTLKGLLPSAIDPRHRADSLRYSLRVSAELAVGSPDLRVTFEDECSTFVGSVRPRSSTDRTRVS